MARQRLDADCGPVCVRVHPRWQKRSGAGTALTRPPGEGTRIGKGTTRPMKHAKRNIIETGVGVLSGLPCLEGDRQASVPDDETSARDGPWSENTKGQHGQCRAASNGVSSRQGTALPAECKEEWPAERRPGHAARLQALCRSARHQHRMGESTCPSVPHHSCLQTSPRPLPSSAVNVLFPPSLLSIGSLPRLTTPHSRFLYTCMRG